MRPSLSGFLFFVLLVCSADSHARPLIYELRGNPEERSKNLERLLFAYDVLSELFKKGVPLGDQLVRCGTISVDSKSLTLQANVSDSLSDEEMSAIAHYLSSELFEAEVSASEGPLKEMVEKVQAAKDRADRELDNERLKILMAFYASLLPPFDSESDRVRTPRFTWPKGTDESGNLPMDENDVSP
jgi:hypothetical protein